MFRRVGTAALAALIGLSGPALTGADLAHLGAKPANAQAVTGFGASGEFTPITPARLVNTRSTSSPVRGLRAFGDTGVMTLNVLGADALDGPADAIPTGNVSAVMLSVTVLSPTQPGHLTVWPGDRARPTASNLNFAKSLSSTNAVFVRPGADGTIKIGLYGAAGGVADVVVDASGYFTTSAGPAGGRLVRINPERILDSRPGAGNVGRAGVLGAKQSFGLTIRGATRRGTTTVVVPNSADVTAVVMNLTAISPTAATVIAAGPATMTSARTIAMSTSTGATRAGLAVIPIGPDGRIHLLNDLGEVHLAGDVLGYFRKGADQNTTLGRVVGLVEPVRAIDTRQNRSGAAAGKLGPAMSETWQFGAFVNSVTVGGVAVGPQNALFGTFTVVRPALPYPTSRSSTFLTVYAGGAARPGTSSLNAYVGQVIPNMVIAPLSATDTLAVYNDYTYVDYLLDVAAVVLE